MKIKSVFPVFIALVLGASIAQAMKGYNGRAEYDDGQEKQEQKLHPTTEAKWSQESIRDAQNRLAERGLSIKSTDGVMNEETTNAIKYYQRSEGLPVTGKLDEKVFETLGVKDFKKQSSEDIYSE